MYGQRRPVRQDGRTDELAPFAVTFVASVHHGLGSLSANTLYVHSSWR